MDPMLLTEAQAAERLNMPAYTLATKRRAGVIPFRDLGDKRKVVRYSEADLAEIIRRSAVKPARGRAR